MLKKVLSRFVSHFNKLVAQHVYNGDKHKSGWEIVVKPYDYEGNVPITNSIHDFGPGTGDYEDSIILSVVDASGHEIELHRIEKEYTHSYLLTRREADVLRENIEKYKKLVHFSYSCIPLNCHENFVILSSYSPDIMGYAY